MWDSFERQLYKLCLINCSALVKCDFGNNEFHAVSQPPWLFFCWVWFRIPKLTLTLNWPIRHLHRFSCLWLVLCKLVLKLCVTVCFIPLKVAHHCRSALLWYQYKLSPFMHVWWFQCICFLHSVNLETRVGCFISH